MSMPCPACGTKAYIRTSRPLSTTVTEQYLHCTNPHCQCVFKSLQNACVVVGKSLLPDSEIPPEYFHLQMSDKSEKAPLPASWIRNTQAGKAYAARQARKADQEPAKSEHANPR